MSQSKRNSEQLSFNREYDSREYIALALENPEYIHYAESSGPLPLDQLMGIEDTDTGREVIDHFGWPDQSDMSIRTAPVFSDNQSFLAALLNDRSSENPNKLGNFMNWLYQEPSLESYSHGEPFTAMYARHPALHRLNVLMPDLMQETRKLLLHIKQKNNADDSFGMGTEGFNKELALGVNNNLVSAMRMAYTVAGRLLTKNDKRLHMTLAMGKPSPDSADVTDAFSELTT